MVCPEFQMLHRTYFQFQTCEVDYDIWGTRYEVCSGLPDS